MKLLTRICIDRPLVGWVVVALLWIPPVLGFCGYRLADPLPAGWVPSEVVEELDEQQRQFNSNTPLVLVLTCEDFFQPDRIEALHQTVARLRNEPGVLSVTWAGDIPEVTLLGRKRMLLPDAESLSEDQLVKAKSELLNHPLVAENLISKDGKTLLLLMDAERSLLRKSGEVSGVDHVRSLADKQLAPLEIDTGVTGILALYGAQQQALTQDNRQIQWLSYAVVATLLLVIFRRPIAIILAGAGPVVGVAWTMGWLHLTGQANNELAKIILPVMVMMIGFTDGVHLIMRFRQMRCLGESVDHGIRLSMQQTGPACFLTSLTTAVGFGSLVLSESDMIAGFGMSAAIGVIVTFLAVIIVSPLLAVSPLGHRMHVSADAEPVTRFVARFVGLISWSSKHARFVTAVGILVTVGGLLLCSRLIPDDRVSDRVPSNSDAFNAMRQCDEQVGGIRSVHLAIEWAPETSRADIWEVVRACEGILSREELLGDPLSIRTALTVIRGRHRPDQSILANQLPDNFRDRFYRPDERRAFVSARTQDWGFAAFDPMFHRVAAALAQLNAEHDQFQVRLVSNVILEGRVVSQMIGEMLHSLAWAAVIIFAIIAIAFRSLRIGFISIVPNVMPLVVAGTLKYFFHGSIGIAGTCSLAICLGIAVDDTIHYLIHFLHERRNGFDVDQANEKTFVAVGSALALTTIVMTAGLMTVLTSHMPPHVNFASMALITLLAALPADLLFLPALLSLTAPSISRKAPAVCAPGKDEDVGLRSESRCEVMVEAAT